MNSLRVSLLHLLTAKGESSPQIASRTWRRSNLPVSSRGSSSSTRSAWSLVGGDRFVGAGLERGDDGIGVVPRGDHDDRDRHFAPFLVGSAHHAQVGDARHTLEVGLDLGGVDVDAGRHDHVGAGRR